jgi:hypothetical protein
MKPPRLRPIGERCEFSTPDHLQSGADRLKAGRIATSDVGDVSRTAKDEGQHPQRTSRRGERRYGAAATLGLYALLSISCSMSDSGEPEIRRRGR